MAWLGGSVGPNFGKGIVGVEGAARDRKVTHTRDSCACVFIGLYISVLNWMESVRRFALDKSGTERGAAKVNGENTTR